MGEREEAVQGFGTKLSPAQGPFTGILPPTLDRGRSQRERTVSAAGGLPGGVLHRQAVISLRPTWPKIPAWVGNGRIAFERLQEIPVANVKEIRLLSREQARVRFGPDAQQTILVVTR